MWRRLAGAVLSVATLASLAVGTAGVANAAEDGVSAGQSAVTGAGQAAQSPEEAQAAYQRDEQLQAKLGAQPEAVEGARAAAQITASQPSGPVYEGLSTSDYNPRKGLPTYKLADNGMFPYVNVTVKGLEAGTEYCAVVAPWDFFSGIKFESHACAKAVGSTAMFKVYLTEAGGDASYFKKYGAHVTVGTKADADRYDKGVSTVVPTVAKTEVSITFKNLKDLISITSLNVEDIGSQTVGLKYGYRIDPQLAGKILNVCPVVSISRAYAVDITDASKAPKNADGSERYLYWGSPKDGDTYCLGNDVIEDSDTSADADARREELHKVATWDLENWDGKNSVKYGTATSQGWTRYVIRDFAKDLGGKLSGTVDDVTLPWLNPNTKYGNWGGETLDTAVADMVKRGETHRADPWSSLYTSLQVKFTDGSYYMSNDNVTNVPDFTTKPLASTTVKEPSASTANASGVTASNGGVAQPKSKYRLYIDNLSKECRALADKGESACSWAAYIYSDPVRLSTPDGQNALVRKDKDGRYYVDVNVPAGYQGGHKIALYDQEGNLKGWTAVRLPVSKFDDVTAATPHASDIQWLAGSAITEGWRNARGGYDYRGAGSVTRQDMAAFLYRLAGSPAFDETKVRNPFVDVSKSTPHYKEILWLAQSGVSTGWKTARGVEFRGMDSVKRQDMAAFLHRLADYRKAKPTLGKAVSFRDVSAKTPHAEDVAWLARTGVTTGWKDGTFRGMNEVVRQDMAAFLHRMKSNVLK